MIERIDETNLGAIVNPSFREYAARYVRIERRFRESVAELGLPFGESEDRTLREEARICGCVGCPREAAPVLPEGLASYRGRGLTVANDGKSLFARWRSDACASCRLGVRAKTFLFSTQCPRRCFFCFNPNQEGLEANLHDAVRELEECAERGATFTHLALTGGEPLLHAEETVRFFRRARELYPDAHTRLYTSGLFLDEPLMEALGDAGLREIRFSVKTEDDSAAIERVLDTIARSMAYLPDVMVEMPVVPGELDLMKRLLVRLDGIGAKGINLLELGYPFANAEAFAHRGLKIKADPLRVLYDYQYAGGLPVAGSEEDCLLLLQFALDEGLRMGVHYCSMENKFTGQIYQQNAPHDARYPWCVMSRKDHFLKTALVFGEDAFRVRGVFADRKVPNERYRYENDHLEFDPELITLLAEALPLVEVGLGYRVIERREGEWVQREVRLDRVVLETFDFDSDV